MASKRRHRGTEKQQSSPAHLSREAAEEGERYALAFQAEAQAASRQLEVKAQAAAAAEQVAVCTSLPHKLRHKGLSDVVRRAE